MAMSQEQAIEACKKAIRLIGLSYPHFLIIHTHLRYEVNDQIGTMGIKDDGTIMISPKFVETLNRAQLGGVICHEECHLVLRHHERRGNRDAYRWNVAGDMCINQALKTDGIQLPQDALYPPQEFFDKNNGIELTTENMYDYLKKNPKHMPKQGKGPAKATAGCGVTETDGPGVDKDGNPIKPNWGEIAATARAMAQQIGTGSCAVADLLKPSVPRIDWKKVVKYGFDMSYAILGKDEQTYAKRNRRSPVDIILPGSVAYQPKIAFCCDVSGSMDRTWLCQMLGEIQKCMRSWPGAKVYLCAHTDVVVWSGWITSETEISKALQFSGGTDPIPAFKDIGKAGKFSTICHLTDLGFGDNAWQHLPKCKMLIIGRFGPPWGATPPRNAKVIPCTKE